MNGFGGLLPDIMCSLRDGKTLPASWYTTNEVFELEKEHIFDHNWHFAAHTSELANNGDFLRREIQEPFAVAIMSCEGVGSTGRSDYRGHSLVDARKCVGLALYIPEPENGSLGMPKIRRDEGRNRSHVSADELSLLEPGAPLSVECPELEPSRQCRKSQPFLIPEENASRLGSAKRLCPRNPAQLH